jgi:hypothetical protein
MVNNYNTIGEQSHNSKQKSNQNQNQTYVQTSKNSHNSSHNRVGSNSNNSTANPPSNNNSKGGLTIHDTSFNNNFHMLPSTTGGNPNFVNAVRNPNSTTNNNNKRQQSYKSNTGNNNSTNHGHFNAVNSSFDQSFNHHHFSMVDGANTSSSHKRVDMSMNLGRDVNSNNFNVLNQASQQLNQNPQFLNQQQQLQQSANYQGGSSNTMIMMHANNGNS